MTFNQIDSPTINLKPPGYSSIDYSRFIDKENTIPKDFKIVINKIIIRRNKFLIEVNFENKSKTAVELEKDYSGIDFFWKKNEKTFSGFSSHRLKSLDCYRNSHQESIYQKNQISPNHSMNTRVDLTSEWKDFIKEHKEIKKTSVLEFKISYNVNEASLNSNSLKFSNRQIKSMIR